MLSAVQFWILSFCLQYRNLKMKMWQSSNTLEQQICIYNFIILPAVLYKCKTWSLTLRMELRLRILKTVCQGEYLDLKERNNNLYCWPDIIRVVHLRRLRWVSNHLQVWLQEAVYKLSQTEGKYNLDTQGRWNGWYLLK
jgi:hypothetical protein